MFDPNAGRFNVDEAEAALGIDDEARRMIRMHVSIDLLLAHAGITEDQIQIAYEARVRNDIRDAAVTLADLIGERVGDED